MSARPALHPPPAARSDPVRRPEPLRRIAEARERIHSVRATGATVALVPTMGALHDGHLALVEHARHTADWVVLSVFVNPLQFGAGEDLSRYPRDLAGDLELAAERDVDAVFAPSAAEMYPDGEPRVSVAPGTLAEPLCGASRPGHFRGVLTVVAKLFGIIGPDVAVFGRKDFQQALLIRRMVYDLNLPVRVEVAPLVREADGLALSSRNRRLPPQSRNRALALSRALGAAAERFTAGERDAGQLRAAMLARLRAAGVQPEYAEVVHPETLNALVEAGEGALCAVAAKVDGVRLIDNTVLGSDEFTRARE